MQIKLVFALRLVLNQRHEATGKWPNLGFLLAKRGNGGIIIIGK